MEAPAGFEPAPRQSKCRVQPLHQEAEIGGGREDRTLTTVKSSPGSNRVSTPALRPSIGSRSEIRTHGAITDSEL